jgi:hypothetical protein
MKPVNTSAKANVRPSLVDGEERNKSVFGWTSNIQRLHIHLQQWLAPVRIHNAITTRNPGFRARTRSFGYHLIHSLQSLSSRLIAIPQSQEVNHA